MIPFLRNKKDAGVSVPIESIKREHDEDKEQDFDVLESAAEELIHAVHSKDIKAVAMALRSAFELMDSEPHIEGEHI